MTGSQWKSTRNLLVFIGVGMVMGASVAQAATTTVNLAWDAVPDPGLAGYRIYQGTNCTAITLPATPVKTVTAPTTTTSITGLADGAYAWKATAFDSAGNESGFSNCVTFQADTIAPAAPGALRVVSSVVTP